MKSERGGQAPSAAMTYDRRMKRGTDELIGLCRGIMADGSVNEQEARFLMDWLYQHREFRASFPFNVLYGRIDAALSDGVLDLDEQRELLEAMHSVIGGEQRGGDSASLSTWAPFCNPPPVIRFANQDFVLTGKFAYGPRSHVASFISAQGGYVKESITHDVSYLVVGMVGSRDWKHSSFGDKIEKAVKLRDEKRLGISIVSEEWMLTQAEAF